MAYTIHKICDYRPIALHDTVNKKILIIFSTPENKNEKTKKSFRNLPNVSLSNSKKVNVYEIINHSLILFTQEAFTEMEERIK